MGVFSRLFGSSAKHSSDLGSSVSTGTVVASAGELAKALKEDKPLVIVSDSGLLKQLPGMFASDVRLFHERAVFKGPKGEAIFACQAAAERYLKGFQDHPLSDALGKERAAFMLGRLKDM